MKLDKRRVYLNNQPFNCLGFLAVSERQLLDQENLHVILCYIIRIICSPFIKRLQKKAIECDQEIPQSHTADPPMAS